MHIVPALLGAFLVLTPAATAQEGDGLPTERVCLVPPGGWIDLDTGLLLPDRVFRSFRADVQFGRDGAGFFLQPVIAGVRAAPRAISPPDDMANERARIAQHDTDALRMFVRTDRGVARVSLMVADTYSTGSAVLRWVVVPPKAPQFLPAPTDLAAAWAGDRLVVTWSGEQPRWLVEVATGGQVQKLTVDALRVELPGLAVKERHVVTVRGLAADLAVSMPATVVQFGPSVPSVHGTVEFADRWHDRCGGLKVSTGEAAVDDAEVVLFLYGVHVPGGGVLKIGSGEDAFRDAHTLPAGPYPPMYGRLDADDVLAIQLADGRYAKLRLEPMRGHVADGLRLHYRFWPDGRRCQLPRPGKLVWDRTPAGITVRWQEVPGASVYRVAFEGRAAVECKTTEWSVADLPADRVFECDVVAVGADAAASELARITLHTFGPGVTHGRGSLEAQRGGFDFAAGRADPGAERPDLALIGGAGGAEVLHFGTLHGIAGAGAAAFGDLAAAAKLEFTQNWTSNRVDGGAVCFVRTAGGGLACVRIVERGWPTTTFEYLFRAP